jgi:hypothetical protein
MANLKTTYMGIALENPIIAGASELTGHIESIQKIAEAGRELWSLNRYLKNRCS